jgi:glycerol kinase
MDIWDCVAGCIRDVLGRRPEVSVVCIGITNQRETALAWDAETSLPLYNAIVWQCRRTADRCAELAASSGVADAIRRICGLPVDAYFSATKFEWLLRNVPRIGVAARRGGLRLGTVDTWLLWRLTGGMVHATDCTNAARTMLYDIERQFVE